MLKYTAYVSRLCEELESENCPLRDSTWTTEEPQSPAEQLKITPKHAAETEKKKKIIKERHDWGGFERHLTQEEKPLPLTRPWETNGMQMKMN